MDRGGAWRFPRARVHRAKWHLLRRHPAAGFLISVINRSSGRCNDSRMVARLDGRPFIVAVLFVGVSHAAAAQTPTEASVPGPRTVLAEAAKDFVGLASLESLSILGAGAA